MANTPSIHPYATRVLDKMDPAIRSSLSDEQRSEIKRVVSQELLSGRKHGFDVRGIIHLLFVKLYYVVILGVDKRAHTDDETAIEVNRRTEISITQQIIFWTIMFIYFVGIIGFFIYHVL